MNDLNAAVQSGPLEKLYTISEAAKILNVKVSKLRKAIFRREIIYIKLGNLVRFREQDLSAYVSSNVMINGKKHCLFPNNLKVC